MKKKDITPLSLGRSEVFSTGQMCVRFWRVVYISAQKNRLNSQHSAWSCRVGFTRSLQLLPVTYTEHVTGDSGRGDVFVHHPPGSWEPVQRHHIEHNHSLEVLLSTPSPRCVHRCFGWIGVVAAETSTQNGQRGSRSCYNAPLKLETFHVMETMKCFIRNLIMVWCYAVYSANLE